MREVNFSIPNLNKASVGITTALYDRRALDCTSTLPLINSLNHLAYLTTSSARIRDILTVDGGIERLVCILKDGRNKDLMSMWKWNLAFQCVVNIGVRGSENVRTRVVEADMVPVIATILDNYVQVIDKLQSKADAANAKRTASGSHSVRSRDNKPPNSFYDRHERPSGGDRGFRRQAPPASIEIPASQALENVHANSHQTLTVPNPAERIAYIRQSHPNNRTHDSRHHFHTYHSGIPARDQSGLQPLAAALPVMDVNVAGFGLRPIRDTERLPSMLQAGNVSQPESPTTPNPPPPTSSSRTIRRSSRPSIRHQRSISGESDDPNADEIPNPSGEVENANEPIVDIQTGEDIEGIDDRQTILGSVDAPMGLAGPHGTDTQDTETFNITHRSPIDGSIINAATNTNPPTANPPLAIPTAFHFPSRYLQDSSSSVVLPSMPREEDVLMSLQLLAYVSKYCNLRSYFQKSHLVPKLSISGEIHLLDEEPSNLASQDQESLEEQEEYLLPDDYNIFPLVEKFTVRHHPPDMQYWAGVVMRNLCRKDDSRGGIRQCAYYECGKWEEYTRQFAKCRRCRRTKYCSKECQKSAWVYHRHWCVQAQQ
ncbi:hypothetical protein P167DRAFT_482124 [Morchella conica CCBAS932]|uniref:MYND-type zinc finger protein samB n=2 Tax=Morchella sect. Distantes TaxID=1051054 RepID=A0A3N4L2Q6_9PEZI|nr:hypothetical protein P167DRAFT_482124 [Morchella conica CCBAS932]